MRVVDTNRIAEAREIEFVPQEFAWHYALGSDISAEYTLPDEVFVKTGMVNPHALLARSLQYVEQELSLMRPVPPFTVQQRIAAMLGATMTVCSKLLETGGQDV